MGNNIGIRTALKNRGRFQKEAPLSDDLETMTRLGEEAKKAASRLAAVGEMGSASLYDETELRRLFREAESRKETGVIDAEIRKEPGHLRMGRWDNVLHLLARLATSLAVLVWGISLASTHVNNVPAVCIILGSMGTIFLACRSFTSMYQTVEKADTYIKERRLFIKLDNRNAGILTFLRSRHRRRTLLAERSKNISSPYALKSIVSGISAGPLREAVAMQARISVRRIDLDQKRGKLKTIVDKLDAAVKSGDLSPQLAEHNRLRADMARTVIARIDKIDNELRAQHNKASTLMEPIRKRARELDHECEIADELAHIESAWKLVETAEVEMNYNAQFLAGFQQVCDQAVVQMGQVGQQLTDVEKAHLELERGGFASISAADVPLIPKHTHLPDGGVKTELVPHLTADTMRKKRQRGKSTDAPKEAVAVVQAGGDGSTGRDYDRYEPFS